ncbi:MAG: hypothetical protein EXX96DRAFT_621393 [Benjaminiella poitrasii]|nr:MAG: hypothetical protein EXX96DRAFT_621393 [Benjaminiella poitrasii]
MFNPTLTVFSMSFLTFADLLISSILRANFQLLLLSSQNILDIETSIVIDDDFGKDYKYLGNPVPSFQEPASYIRSETPPLFTLNETISSSNFDADEIFNSKKINESTNAFDKVLLILYELHNSGTLEGRIAASSEITNFVWALGTYKRGRCVDCSKLFNFFLDNLSPSVRSLTFSDSNNVSLRNSMMFMPLHAYHTLLSLVILINLFIEMLQQNIIDALMRMELKGDLSVAIFWTKIPCILRFCFYAIFKMFATSISENELFNMSNKNPKENKNMRPDATITKTQQLKYGYSLGHGKDKK